MEKRIMTKEQAQELVKNTKYIIWNEDESSKLQMKLFEIGCRWLHSGKTICNTNQPFLMVDEYLNIRYRDADSYEYFEKEKNLLTEAYYIHIIELEQPKPKFDPKTLQVFDKVLVRENEKQTWRAKFFHCKKGEQFYTIEDSVYQNCIPYNDDTKHLLGTREDAPEFYKLD